jgi:hypothetical protein
MELLREYDSDCDSGEANAQELENDSRSNTLNLKIGGRRWNVSVVINKSRRVISLQTCNKIPQTSIHLVTW